jgi:3-hydroxyacyl-CoA dehydrogenase
LENVLVIGTGFMGRGIAQVCAQSGYRVYLKYNTTKTLEKAMDEIKWSLEKLGSKGLLKDLPQDIFQRITPEKDLSSAAKADWVIESVLEIEDLKVQIFKEVDLLSPPTTPLATNSSTMPMSHLAKAIKHPERMLGLHFFGPVPLMGVVEVIKGEKTSDDIFERGVAFVKSLGKTPIRVMRDIPGFVMNRIFAASWREALDLVDKGITTPEDVDKGMRLGYGWAAGPFEIADNAGLDTYALIDESWKALGAEDLTPRSDLVVRMVKEGRLGRKVGKGFYNYTADGKRLPWEDK